MKRIISIAITLLMLLTCIPAMAFAAEPGAPAISIKEGTNIEIGALYANKTLHAVDADGEALTDVTWTSSNPTVAAVDADGVVTTKGDSKVGDKVTVTAKDAEGNEANIEIVLGKLDISNTKILELDYSRNSVRNVKPGETAKFSIDAYDEDGNYSEDRLSAILSKINCTESTEPKSVVPEEVEIKAGTGYIEVVPKIYKASEMSFTSESEYIEGVFKLNVYTPDAMKLTPNTLYMDLDETQKIEVTLQPDIAIKEVEFISENPEIARVDKSGNVTSVAEGETVINVTQKGGEGYTASAKVRVLKAGYYIIEGGYANIEDYSKRKYINGTLELTSAEPVFIKYFDAKNSKTGLNGSRWQSTDSNVCTVEWFCYNHKESGTYIPHANGTAYIKMVDGFNAEVAKPLKVKVNVTGFDNAPVDINDKKAEYEKQLLPTSVPEKNPDGSIRMQTQTRSTLEMVGRDDIYTVPSNETYFENHITSYIDKNAAEFSLDVSTTKGNIRRYDLEKNILPYIKLYKKSDMTKPVAEFDGKENGTLVITALDDNNGKGKKPVNFKFKVKENILEDGTEYALVIDPNLKFEDWFGKHAIFFFSTDPIPAESITLDKNELTMEKGSKDTIKATLAPDNVTDKNVTWKSSDESTVTVDANGNITAVGVGEAVITATSGDGKVSAECKVTVKDIPSDGNDDTDNNVPSDENNNQQENENAAQTGDSMNIMVFLGLMLAAVIAGGAVFFTRKARQ